MSATPAARNPHEAVARARKVAKLLQFIRSCGGDKTAEAHANQATYLEELSQENRDLIAGAAGCNTPSETTWSALVKAVRERTTGEARCEFCGEDDSRCVCGARPEVVS